MRPENKFIENPPRQLCSNKAVHITVEDKGLAHVTNAELVFYLRLKATPGCISKIDLVRCTMHLYIEPNSDAARLFVSRMRSIHCGLKPGDSAPRLVVEQMRKLLPAGTP